jgi:hypothetical protein
LSECEALALLLCWRIIKANAKHSFAEQEALRILKLIIKKPSASAALAKQEQQGLQSSWRIIEKKIRYK